MSLGSWKDLGQKRLGVRQDQGTGGNIGRLRGKLRYPEDENDGYH